MQGRELQFIAARSGEPFQVQAILGGEAAAGMLLARGIEPGTTIVLESVAQAQSLTFGVKNPVIISSREGLRLFLARNQGKQILVRESRTDQTKAKAP
jgi:hypothetical protein